MRLETKGVPDNKQYSFIPLTLGTVGLHLWELFPLSLPETNKEHPNEYGKIMEALSGKHPDLEGITNSPLSSA